MAEAVTMAAEPAGEGAEKQHDQDDDEDQSKRHGAPSERRSGCVTTHPAAPNRAYSGPPVVVDPPITDDLPSPLVGTRRAKLALGVDPMRSIADRGGVRLRG